MSATPPSPPTPPGGDDKLSFDSDAAAAKKAADDKKTEEDRLFEGKTEAEKKEIKAKMDADAKKKPTPAPKKSLETEDKPTPKDEKGKDAEPTEWGGILEWLKNLGKVVTGLGFGLGILKKMGGLALSGIKKLVPIYHAVRNKIEKWQAAGLMGIGKQLDKETSEFKIDQDKKLEFEEAKEEPTLTAETKALNDGLTAADRDSASMRSDASALTGRSGSTMTSEYDGVRDSAASLSASARAGLVESKPKAEEEEEAKAGADHTRSRPKPGN